jgi:hypothetical protein
MGHKAHKEPMETRVLMEHKARRVSKAHKVLLEYRVPMGSKVMMEHKAQPVHKGLPARKVLDQSVQQVPKAPLD